MKKVTVAILFGGHNSEYEVSRMSSTSVLRNIDKERFEVLMVGITQEGAWYLFDGPVEDILADTWHKGPHITPTFFSVDRLNPGFVLFDQKQGAQITLQVDVVFPVMHGRYAEDGTLQGMFAVAGVPCVGPGTCSSALCMDKEFSHILLEHAKIPCARWLCLRKWTCPIIEDVEGLVNDRLGGYPVFVKPANAGSSMGVSKARDQKSLQAALDLAFTHDEKVLLEEAIVGKEVECAVLGNHRLTASTALGEIVPKAEFYDYNAKYFDDATDLYIPARVDEKTVELIRTYAQEAYRIHDCLGLSRVDFFVRGPEDVILNEINTIPGFTHASMYPKLFEASGLPYPQLITQLLDLAMEGLPKEALPKEAQHG